MANRRGVKTEEGSKNVAARLANFRKSRGFTQVEIAKLLGVSQPVYSRYESAEVNLNAELVIQLAQILRISADEFLGLKESAAPLAPLDRQLLRRLQKIEQLSRRQRQALIRMIDEFLARVAGRAE